MDDTTGQLGTKTYVFVPTYEQGGAILVLTTRGRPKRFTISINTDLKSFNQNYPKNKAILYSNRMQHFTPLNISLSYMLFYNNTFDIWKRNTLFEPGPFGLCHLTLNPSVIYVFIYLFTYFSSRLKHS